MWAAVITWACTSSSSLPSSLPSLLRVPSVDPQTSPPPAPLHTLPHARHILIHPTYRGDPHFPPPPLSLLCTCMASLLSKLGTLSHSFCSSFMAAGESRSGRMESACPSLMYAGPRLVWRVGG